MRYSGSGVEPQGESAIFFSKFIAIAEVHYIKNVAQKRLDSGHKGEE